MLGNILLFIVSTCTYISYIPQIIKIIKNKSADDISVSSWILWVISSCSYAFYAVLVSKEFMLIFECCSELGFCLIILILAIKYQNIKKN